VLHRLHLGDRADRPLEIQIVNDGMESIIVSNNLQRKATVEGYSAKSGLENIIKRYRYLCDRPPEIIDGPERFTVKLPLLNLGMF